MSDFVKGFYYLLWGFTLVREPKLRRHVWVPLLINIVLFIILFLSSIFLFKAFSAWIENLLPHWLQWLHWLVWILSVALGAILLAFVTTFIVNLICAPYNSVLSEKIMHLLNQPIKPRMSATIVSLPSSVWRQLQFLSYYLTRVLIFLVLFFIPVVQMVAGIIWFLFNAWMFSMQYLDYPMENDQIKLETMKKIMKGKFTLCLGFGCAVLLFTLIPFINFIIVPVAVAGGTLLYVRSYVFYKD